MDWKLELVAIPVSDVERAKAFYVDQVGFTLDHDHQVADDLRFIQLTPVGSGCSITIGTGITDAEPGSVRGVLRDLTESSLVFASGSGRSAAYRTATPEEIRLRQHAVEDVGDS